MNDNDIYDLQIKISYLEGFVNELNGVIIEQDKSGSQMRREIGLLKNKIEQLEERIENKGHDLIHDDAPPHY